MLLVVIENGFLRMQMENTSLWRDLFGLDGQTALVTGGTKGLGYEIAKTLCGSGANVAICSRNGQESNESSAQITALTGQRCVGLTGDVTEIASIERIQQEAREQLGPIDILVANAGTNIRKTIDQMSVAEWDSVISLNLRAAFLLAKAVLPEMKERRYGRLVFLGSIHSHISLPGYTAYAASKAGLLGLTRALALEYAPHGICINALCPGFIKTPLTAPLREKSEINDLIIAKTPVGRWGETADIRGVTLLLCSPAASFMTGTSLSVDGGWTSQ
jgi:NAD(P)-dependent dehydrogenase (short-subunit alcohol dehydrogenase family)